MQKCFLHKKRFEKFMKREDKKQVIENLAEKLTENSIFYLTDTSELNVATVNKLRGLCFKRNVSMHVVKNTLLKKAMEKVDKDLEPFYDTLKGPTSIMFSDTGNVPAKLIKEFRKTNKSEKPILKAAFVAEECYIGENNLEALINIKSKEELIGDLISLLQSPAKNVISGLKSGGGKLSGIIETLSKKEEK